jgi:glycerate-2-kinase
VEAQGAAECTLLISEVPEDARHIVGSGPSLPDPFDFVAVRASVRFYMVPLRHVSSFHWTGATLLRKP